MLARQMRAERYAKPHNEWLQRIIREDLLTYDFDETRQAYAGINGMMLSHLERGHLSIDQVYENRALLGCNDRYYLLTGILNRKDLLHPWIFARCREVEAEPYGHMDLWARGHYKAVVLSESVPTPQGWKLHGDLAPGDQVFGPDGKPCLVMARTPVFNDADCYRVTFDDGFSTVVSGEHLWTVDYVSRNRIKGTNRRVGLTQKTVSTQELSAKLPLYCGTRLIEPLVYPTAKLPIDPYILGCWLGDGNSSAARMICSTEDWPHFKRQFERSGHVTRVFEKRENAVAYALDPRDRGRTCLRGHDRKSAGIYRGQCKACRKQWARLKATGQSPDPYTATGLAWDLRRAGLLCDPSGVKKGASKHIPDVYFRSSATQRLALLQGLMDTDGHCDTRGTATFANTKEVLAQGVFDLAASLGLKPHKRQVNGKYKGAVYISWQVSFQGYRAEAPFRLKRKLSRCLAGVRHHPRRFFRSIERVASVPVSCIQVDRPDGLYVIGRHMAVTHNSTIITFAGIIQELMVDPNQKIVIFSAVKPIAAAFLSQIKDEFENNEGLKLTYHDVLYRNPRTRGIDGKPAKWGLGRGITVKRKSNPKEASIEAHGLLDGQPTSRHYDKMHFDDIVTQDYLSEEQIIKTTLRFEMADNLGTHNGCDKALAGTYYHFNDTHVQMRDRGSFKVRVYPATDDGTLTGTPVLMSPGEWEKKKRDQRSTVATQMLCNPSATGDATFLSTWLRGYEAIPTPLNVYIMCDPSKGSTERSDRTAIAVIGIDQHDKKYLLDGYCHRMKLSERYRMICELRRKWMQHRGVCMVRVGYERYGMLTDLEVINDMMISDDDVFEIIELNTPRQGGHSKNDRIQRLEPDICYERFYFPCVGFNPNTGGDSYWTVWTPELAEAAVQRGVVVNANVGQILWRQVKGPLRRMAELEKTGQHYRIPTPIKRRDSDNNLYDLTREFFEQMIRHPFGAHDDLIDAASRIYDMDPQAPQVIDAGATESLEAQFDTSMWG